MTEPALNARTFNGKVSHVDDPTKIRVMIDLDFGVKIEKVIILPNAATKLPPSKRSDAMHCMVLLLGGKRVLVQPFPESPKTGDVRGRLFLCEKLHGSPMGTIPAHPDHSRPVLDVSAYYAWLAQNDFDVGLVRQVVTGKGQESK